MNKINVGILGATGSVGQKFIQLLNEHPQFNVAELGASVRSAGKKYKDAVNWIMPDLLNTGIGDLIVKECKPELFASKVIFSALDSSVAGEIETEFANNGFYVISNARNHRNDDDVPLVIPEVNPEHLEMVKGKEGFIVTNPNCSTIGLTLALKPLHDSFGLKQVNVVTMQAVSGGGYPGLSVMDIHDNVVPYISGEEEKIIYEPAKILGKLADNKFVNANIEIDAQCNRVNVLDGHLETVQVTLNKKATLEEVKEALESFTGLPQELNLHSAPQKPIVYFEEERFPQTRLHRDLGKGMTVSVGRLREDKFFDYKFVVLSHNTVRGAAGGTILIAELMQKNGYFKF